MFSLRQQPRSFTPLSHALVFAASKEAEYDVSRYTEEDINGVTAEEAFSVVVGDVVKLCVPCDEEGEDVSGN